jgi:hypothetical protein
MSAGEGADVREAEGKLFSYAGMYGKEIYRMTPDEAWAKARQLREESKTKEVPESLTLLAQSVHFQSIAACLQTVSSQPRPPR